MSLIEVLIVIGAALLIGVGCQFIGRSRESYEWEIGSVGALYGELLGFRFVQGGLPVVPLLMGAISGGLLVLVFRVVGSPIAAARKSQSEVAPATCTQLVRLSFAPELIQDAVIYRMRTRCGVTTRFVHAEITANQEGWIELWISGSEPAIAAALDVARASGIEVLSASQAPAPRLVAA